MGGPTAGELWSFESGGKVAGYPGSFPLSSTFVFTIQRPLSSPVNRADTPIPPLLQISSTPKLSPPNLTLRGGAVAVVGLGELFVSLICPLQSPRSTSTDIFATLFASGDRLGSARPSHFGESFLFLSLPSLLHYQLEAGLPLALCLFSRSRAHQLFPPPSSLPALSGLTLQSPVPIYCSFPSFLLNSRRRWSSILVDRRRRTLSFRFSPVSFLLAYVSFFLHFPRLYSTYLPSLPIHTFLSSLTQGANRRKHRRGQQSHIRFLTIRIYCRLIPSALLLCFFRLKLHEVQTVPASGLKELDHFPSLLGDEHDSSSATPTTCRRREKKAKKIGS